MIAFVTMTFFARVNMYVKYIHISKAIQNREYKTGNAAVIRHISYIAVRKTGVSRHHVGPMKPSESAPCTSQHYRIGGLRGPFIGPLLC